MYRKISGKSASKAQKYSGQIVILQSKLIKILRISPYLGPSKLKNRPLKQQYCNPNLSKYHRIFFTKNGPLLEKSHENSFILT